MVKSVGVVVMGVSGSGKSTIASKLAASLDAPFIEGDALHDSRSVAKMAAGLPLSDEDRWPWLDRVADSLSAAVASDGIVFASCSALRRAYRDRLRQRASCPLLFVLLDLPIDVIATRLDARTGHFMPRSLLESQFALLERPLDEADGVAVSGGDAEILVRQILQRLDLC